MNVHMYHSCNYPDSSLISYIVVLKLAHTISLSFRTNIRDCFFFLLLPVLTLDSSNYMYSSLSKLRIIMYVVNLGMTIYCRMFFFPYRTCVAF